MSRRVEERTSTRARSGWFGPAALGVLVLAALARLKDHATIFADDRVYPLEGDGAYHLHRIVTLTQDPSYPGVFDPMTNWPEGAVSLWSPGFDWLGVAFAWLCGGASSPERAAQAAAVLPVLWGLLVVGATMVLVRRLPRANDAAAIAAGSFVALLPQSVAIASLGRVDHHVTEALSVALLMIWTAGADRFDEPATTVGERARREALGAVLIAGSTWVMSVALVYVALAAAVLGLSHLRRAPIPVARLSALTGSGVYAFLGAAVILAVAYAPVVAAHGLPFSYAFPSYFQPACLVIAAGWVLGARTTPRRSDTDPTRASSARRMMWASLLPAAVALVLMVVLPRMREALWLGFTEYGGSGDPWLERIDEIEPLFSGGFARAESYWGLAAWLAPLLVACGCLAQIKRDRPSGVELIAWTAVLLALSVAQNRWLRGFTIPFAVASGIALSAAVTEAARRFRATRRNAALRRRLVPAGTTAVAAVILLAADARALFTPADRRAHPSLQDAATFLLEHHPPGGPDAEGVLAEWDLGQELLFLSKRPIVSGGFGPFTGRDGFLAEQEAWSASAPRFVEILDERRLGHVVVGAETFFKNVAGPGVGPPFGTGLDGRAGINPAYFKAVALANLMLGGTAMPNLDVPHHDRLMPIYASPATIDGSGAPLPALWVFERVAGALLVGKAAPRSRVVAEIFLRNASGDVPYRAYADAGASGAFELRFPVWVRHKVDSLQSSKSVFLHRAGAASLRVEVLEEHVRQGARLEVAPPTR